MTVEEIQKKFGITIILEPIKGCWFIAGRDWSNYTSIKGVKAHRLIYKTYRGPWIDGKEICHDCDRKGCINPSHLYQGTHAQNMHDALNRNRLNHPMATRSRMKLDLLFLDRMLKENKIDEFEHQKLRVKVIATYTNFYQTR